MILLLCAFAGRGVATFFAYAACLLVHPTALFLAPMVVPVLLIQRARQISDAPSRQWRCRSRSQASLGVFLGGIALYTKSRNVSVAYYTLLYRPMNWRAVLEGFGGFVTSVNAYARRPGSDPRWLVLAPWAGTFAVAVLLGAGIRRSGSERAAEVAGRSLAD